MSKSKSSLLKIRLKKQPGLLLGLFVLMLMALAFARELGRVAKEPVTAWSQDITADCAVVLTGGSNRVKEGLALLSRGQIKKLIVSGVYANAQLREIFPLWAFYGNIHEKDVILDRRSGTTYGNAQQTLPIIEALSCRDVALVTSNLHMYRARRTFGAAYPSNIPIYPFAVNTGHSESTWYEVSTEVLKSLFYSLWAY